MGTVFFDSNCCVGKRGRKHRLELWRTEDVLAVMDQCGVSAALVYGGWAKDYAPRYGNERLTRELAKSKRLYGCYTVMPRGFGGFYDPAEAVAKLREAGMRAARIFPATHNFSPDERTMGEYYSTLARAGIPLLADAAELRGLDAAAPILQNHPDLPLLLQGVSWADALRIYPLLRDFPNLYLDLSVLQANRIVERITREFGAERLVFGSGIPKMSLGAARAFLDYADINEDEKQMIAGGNLARLCSLTLPEPMTPQNDAIALEAAAGRPQSVFVFDSHTHILEPSGDCGGGLPMPDGDWAHMEPLFDRMGVDRACVAPWPAIWTDSEEGNGVALDMIRQSPDKLCGYVLIDPNYVEDVGAEARKYHLEHRFPGVKMFYNRTGVRYNDPVYAPWWKIAEENHLFALMDSGGYPSFLRDVEELALAYPNVIFFLDHAGRSFEIAEEYAPYAKKYPNVYLQLTFTSVPQGVIEYLAGEGLADKTLYGTDAPMRDPRPQLGWVAYANISPEDKKKILGETMSRILARCFPG